MTRLVLYVILALIVARLLWRFVYGVLEGVGYFQPQPPQGVGLVRDPVCGVFVVPTRALSAGSGVETRYFCSEKCRSQWKQQR